MAFLLSHLISHILALVTILLILPLANSTLQCYTSIFSFGDSLTDTGNFLHEQAIAGKLTHEGRFPYGMTYFHHPTGRPSDGRLVIDFIAEAFGLPFLPPYLASSSDQSFKQGVNFAVSGATAMDAVFLKERGIPDKFTNDSLGVQLNWFEKLLPSLCPKSSNCQDKLRTSLFVVGEIGGNDYNHPLFHGWKLEKIKLHVPRVIDVITSTIETLIKHGATTFVVPGIPPIGCLPASLTIFNSPSEEDYSPKTGCLKRLNKFIIYHNWLLLKELDRIRALYPHATIIYADYYNAFMRIYRSPTKFGFSKDPLKACCGGSGPYNYNTSVVCGNGASVCDEPSSYVSWDGIHFTEAVYKFIATALIKGPFTSPHISTQCLSLATHNTST